MWLVVALGLILRTLFVWNKSMWIDETMAVYVAHGSIDVILFNIPVVYFHPPLFLTLLHYAIVLFGETRLVWALPSIIAGSLSIYFIMRIAKRFLSDRAAIIAGLVAAFSPFLLFMSQEVFDYSLLLFFGILSFDLLLGCLERHDQPWRWVLWGLALVAGLYTHLFMGFVVLAELITFLFWKGKKASHFWGVIIAGVVAFLAYLPFIMVAISVMGRLNIELAQYATMPGPLEIVKKALGIPYYHMAGLYFSDLDWDRLKGLLNAIRDLLLFLCLAFFPAMIAIRGLLAVLKADRNARAVVLPLFIIPLSLTFLPGINARQLSILCLGLVLVMGAGLDRLLISWKEGKKLLAGFLIAGMALTWCFSDIAYYKLQENPMRQENWHNAYAFIEANCQPYDAIYNHSSLGGEVAQRVYYKGDLPRYSSNNDASALTPEDVRGVRGILIHLDENIDRLLQTYQRVWLVYPDFHSLDFDEMIENAKKKHFSTEWRMGRDLRLILFER